MEYIVTKAAGLMPMLRKRASLTTPAATPRKRRVPSAGDLAGSGSNVGSSKRAWNRVLKYGSTEGTEAKRSNHRTNRHEKHDNSQKLIFVHRGPRFVGSEFERAIRIDLCAS